MAAAARQYNAEQNIIDRQLVVTNSQEMVQQVYSQSVTTPVVGNVINIPLKNVGLNKRIIVEVAASVAQSAAETQNLTKWGLANFFSNVQVTDLSNYTRINTSGWHLYALASLRRQAAFGAAYLNDAPVQMGSNFAVNSAPASIEAIKTVRMFFELPLAYNDNDLRGAIYAAVVNATWNLQLTINPAFFAVLATTDPTLSVYQSSTADVGALSAVTITVYQVYLDQIPFASGQPIVPRIDLATAYLLNNTTMTAIVANADFPVPYANFRQFYSTIAIYDNGGTLNNGSDVNYAGIQAANLTFLLKADPYFLALRNRNNVMDDFPSGTYVFDTRVKPINTAMYGNTQLVFNVSSAATGAQLLIGYEAMALLNQAINAGSLAGN